MGSTSRIIVRFGGARSWLDRGMQMVEKASRWLTSRPARRSSRGIPPAAMVPAEVNLSRVSFRIALTAPGELRGRVLAADWAVVVAAGGTQPGSLESGALAALTTPVISAFAGGVACSAAIVAIGVALPGLARYRLPQRLSAQLRNGLRAFAPDTSVDRCLALQLAAAFSVQPRVMQPGSRMAGLERGDP